MLKGNQEQSLGEELGEPEEEPPEPQKNKENHWQNQQEF